MIRVRIWICSKLYKCCLTFYLKIHEACCDVNECDKKCVVLQ